jgi:hypothetical protein
MPPSPCCYGWPLLGSNDLATQTQQTAQPQNNSLVPCFCSLLLRCCRPTDCRSALPPSFPLPASRRAVPTSLTISFSRRVFARLQPHQSTIAASQSAFSAPFSYSPLGCSSLTSFPCRSAPSSLKLNRRARFRRLHPYISATRYYSVSPSAHHV